MKFSIITVTHNSERFLEQTILSVLSQSYPNIEYIIIDGCSKDTTVDIINKYRDRLSYFISEPDKNMYEAINKGIKIATGDYIAILNSDDYYVNNNVIRDVACYIKKNANKLIGGVYGNLIKISENNSVIRKRRCFQLSHKELLLSKKLSFVGHATLFISKQCVEQIGFYNSEDFYYASDYDYVLKCFQNYKFKYINLDIFNFRVHGASITSSGKIRTENESILKKNCYYDYSSFERFVFYYYLWGKFIILNFKYLLNKL